MANTDIQLHPRLGVNARCSFCPQCQGPSDSLLLLGIDNGVWECCDCKTRVYGVKEPLSSTSSTAGRRSDRNCPRCKGNRTGSLRALAEHERVPGGLCKPCDEERAVHAAEVAAGGVHFTCKDCKTKGVVPAAHPLAAYIRAQLGVKAPDGCGVEFSAETCPVCATAVASPAGAAEPTPKVN